MASEYERGKRRSYIPCSLQQRQRQQQRVSSAFAWSSTVTVTVIVTVTVTSVVLMTGLLPGATAFTTSPSKSFRTVSYQRWPSSSSRRTKPVAVDAAIPAIEPNTVVLFSSVGDGNSNGGDGNGNGNDNNKDDNDLGDFLDPMKKPDSEDMKRAREYMSETSLPISFDVVEGSTKEPAGDDGNSNSDDNGDNDGEGDTENKSANLMIEGTPSTNVPAADSSSLVSSSSSSSSSSLGNATSSALFGKGPSPSLLAKNPYTQVVSKISPSDLIAKFTAESDPRVQEAVRTTILGLIGSLPKLAFETTSVTTGQRLASLMFQLQMTGYMFKNAEYRLSMSQSLGMSDAMSSNLLLTGFDDEFPDKEDDPLVSGKIKGKLKIRYGKKDKGSTSEATGTGSPEDAPGAVGDDSSSTDNENENKDDGMEIEVDAAAYMSELRDEVSRLRDELTETKESKDEALRKDLLLYIRTLPGQELKSLTNTMSQDVLVCMKGLVQAVLAGIGDGKIGPDTVTEQSGEAMAQLCMWQLAVGYNLRELEVREEMKKNMKTLIGGTPEDDIDLSEPGAFE